LNTNYRYIITLLALIAIFFTFSEKVLAADIKVVIENPPAKGPIVLLLFDSANTFGDIRNPFRQYSAVLEDNDSYIIENIPAGEYALLIYGDLNKNGILDKNFIGIPREPVGFSNNYRPKGPPSYSKAKFELDEGVSVNFDVLLEKPLGDNGRIGAGIGIIMRSSPYLMDSEIVYRVIPAITYIGERLQIIGPNLKVGLIGTGDLRLALSARYRIGAYEEDDSPALTGMGDRDDTLLLGFALEYDLPRAWGIDLSAGYEHDVLDRIGGGESYIEVEKSLQWGRSRIAPSARISWLSSELSNHDFGVPDSNAIPGRPAYTIGSAVSYEIGVSTYIEVTESLGVNINAQLEFLGDEVRESPIVSESRVIKGFSAISYIF